VAAEQQGASMGFAEATGLWYIFKMAMTYLSERVTVDPDVCFGKPCIRGMRLRVSDILDLLEGGADEAEVLETYPDLEVGDVPAALAFASGFAAIPQRVAAN
jgi:uncharacterized protein (DUF433 family)